MRRREGYSFCIIAGGRRPAKIAKLLETIRAQQIPEAEIIVAGKAEVEGAVYLDMPDAAEAGLTCLLRNAAAESSTREWIVFADDDIALSTDWWAALREHRQDSDMISTRLLNLDGTRHWDWATTGGPRGQALLDYDETDPYVYLTGGLMIMKAQVWSEVRWDERLKYRQAEDVVFSREAFRQGFKFSFCRDCISVHCDETYTQIGRKVPRRTSEGASIWAGNLLAGLDPDGLIARADRECEQQRLPEAVDCLRYALYIDRGHEPARRRLSDLEREKGGPTSSGEWSPHPII